MIRQVLLFSITAICVLLPGCSTIPGGNDPGTLAITKAKDVAAHVGGRYLHKKMDHSNEIFPSIEPPDPALQAVVHPKDIETTSTKSQGKELVNTVLDNISSAFGWEHSKPNVHYPSYVPFETGQGFSADKSISESFTETHSIKRGRPVARYHDRSLSLGYSWRF